MFEHALVYHGVLNVQKYDEGFVISSPSLRNPPGPSRPRDRIIPLIMGQPPQVQGKADGELSLSAPLPALPGTVWLDAEQNAQHSLSQ